MIDSQRAFQHIQERTEFQCNETTEQHNNVRGKNDHKDLRRGKGEKGLECAPSLVEMSKQLTLHGVGHMRWSHKHQL